MEKIRVYVSSKLAETVNYIDMHSLEHPCSQAGEKPFEGLKNLPSHSSGFLSDDETKTIDLIDQFSREKKLEYEIVDLSKAGAATQLKFILKGWKTPVITFGKQVIQGKPTKEQLESMLLG